MPEFIVRGRVTYDGVEFFVTAKNSQEAIEKAKAGEYHNLETHCAEVVDWTCRNEAEVNGK